jgi:hypothetical protein
LRGVALALLAAAAAFVATFAREAPKKKLIEWGWDEPDTAFLRAHIREMERTPFDGCVYHVLADTPAGPVNVSWRAWSGRAFQDSELARAAEDLRRTPFRRFRSNLLRLNVTPGDLDWYDDHQPLLGNARRLARLARIGRGAGIALDTEQYEGRLFDYSRQRGVAQRSLADYSAQARRRGRELMQALEDGFPGLSVLLTFGPSYMRSLQVSHGYAPQNTTYALLLPFVDGMIEGTRSGRIVDGHELAYAFKEPRQFEAAYRLMRETGDTLAADPVGYTRALSFGFGIWIDYDWRSRGWNEADARANYFQPHELEAATRAALLRSDEFVWIYSEQPRWWSASGPVKLPPAYADALARAKRQAAGRARRPR